MNFSVKVLGFKNAISHVIDVATKDFIKDSVGENKIVIAPDSQGISVSAFNGKMSIVEELSDINNDDLNYTFNEDGEVTISAKDLVKVLDSFSPNEIIVFEQKADSSEVYIKKSKDDEQYQTLPCYKQEIAFPRDAAEFDKEIEIRRDILLIGIDRIFFATGFEEQREKYLYWIMRINKNDVRFAAGTGAIFSVVNFSGDDIIKSDKYGDELLISKDHTPVLCKILSSLTCDKIVIKQSSATDDKAPYQIVVSTPNMKIKMVGMVPNISWIDESVILDSEYDSKMIIDISELEMASKGTMATINEEIQKSNKITQSQVIIDPSKSIMTVQTKDLMKSVRKVPIVDYYSKDGDKDEHQFVCSSTYLKDVTKFSSKTKYVQLEMVKNKNDDSKKKAILFRYYANDKVSDANKIKNENSMAGISETLNIFFVQLQK